jgi:aromatase
MNGHREVTHEIAVDAPAAEVYRLVADVCNWPVLFPPTVYVDHVERSTGFERIRLWATANGQAKTWTSRRTLDPDRLRIEFRQEASAPPVASMGGTWLVEPVAHNASRVRLLHDYRAVGDDPEQLRWIDAAVDRNSRAELAALKAGAERATGDPVFSFADTVAVNGAAEDVYDFLNNAAQWPQRLPHVARAVLTEDSPGLQILELDTTTAGGATHTTRSVRVCFPRDRIVYKQITLPALLALHIGEWVIAGQPAGEVMVTAAHTVSIEERNITAILGPGASIGQAREFVRNALRTNSLATLGMAKNYAEARRRPA